MDLTDKQFKEIWDGMTEAQREKVRNKARWERMTLWAVLQEWSNLIPKKLRPKPPRKET